MDSLDSVDHFNVVAFLQTCPDPSVTRPRLQSLLTQATLHAHGLDDPPPPQALARLMSASLPSSCLVYHTHRSLVVREENKAGEMELVFDIHDGAALQNVCQWFVEKLKNQKKT